MVSRPAKSPNLEGVTILGFTMRDCQESQRDEAPAAAAAAAAKRSIHYEMNEFVQYDDVDSQGFPLLITSRRGRGPRSSSGPVDVDDCCFSTSSSLPTDEEEMDVHQHQQRRRHYKVLSDDCLMDTRVFASPGALRLTEAGLQKHNQHYGDVTEKSPHKANEKEFDDGISEITNDNCFKDDNETFQEEHLRIECMRQAELKRQRLLEGIGIATSMPSHQQQKSSLVKLDKKDRIKQCFTQQYTKKILGGGSGKSKHNNKSQKKSIATATTALSSEAATTIPVTNYSKPPRHPYPVRIVPHNDRNANVEVIGMELREV